MNKERMFLLADLLDKLKPVKFNMADWFSTYDGYAYDDLSQGEDPDDHAELQFTTNNYQQMNGYDCDSAACIAGWAVVMKNDFSLDRPDEETITGGSFRGDMSHMPILIEACEYLGLTRKQGLDLFTKDDDSVWDRNAANLGLTETANYETYGHVDLDDITPKIAAKLIRRVAKGEIDLND